MSESAPRRRYLLLDFPHVVSCISVAAGALVLLGWFFDVTTLKGMLPGWTLVKANTAAAMILCGVALWETQARAQTRPWQLVGQVCSGVVFLLGLLTVAEYVSGLDFGIDQLLIREVTSLPGDIPGRMAVNTALALAALAAALLLVFRGPSRLITGVHALLIVPIMAAGSALIGYSYDIEQILREKLNYTPMAFPTAVIIILLALGVASARPEYPFRRFLASASAAGIMVRRLLPAVIIFSLAIGWLVRRGYRAGIFTEVSGLALFTAVNITWLAIMVLASARAFDKADAKRKQAEEELRAASLYARSLIEASPDPLVTISGEGKIIDVNKATEKATGVARNALIGSDFSNYFTEPDKARAGYQEVFATGLVTDYPLAIRHTSGKTMDVLYNARVYHNPQGDVAGVFAAARDVTERKKNEAVNAVRLRLVQFALTHTLDELMEEAINEAERLTGSLIGFYHFVEPDQISLTLQTWSTRTKREFCKAEGKGLHYPINEAGVWADCVRQGKPVIHNDYASLPNRKGMPTGHATVIRELVVPVHRGTRLSAILGVGNKATDYTQADVEAALLIADLTGEIAARKRAEEALRERDERLRLITETIQDVFWISTPSVTKMLYVSPAYERLWQRTCESLYHDPASFLEPVHPDDLPELKHVIELHARGEAYEVQYRIVRNDGEVRWMRERGFPIRNDDGSLRAMTGIVSDITERKKLERELERQAHTDMLTNLNNRRYFMELAEHELERSKRHNEPLSLLMVDVDHFKAVNDTYGHDVGDAVLQQLSEVCRHTFRGIDIVGRLGGEEFVALLPETNMEQAMEVAERLRQAVESSGANLEDGSLVHFTISAGVTSFRATDDKIGGMLKRADAALYKAKNSGRNRVCGQAESEDHK